MTTTRDPRRNCDAWLEQIHRELDGDALDAGSLQRHLASCARCREARADLRLLHETLCGLPEVPLPDDALAELRRRTRSRRPLRVHGWRAAAAAAIVGAIVWGAWPKGPSEAELALAAAQTRKVLGVTAQALRRTERAAFQEVLAGEVSPALRSMPIQWPKPSARGGKGGRSET